MSRNRWRCFGSLLVGTLSLPVVGCSGEEPSHAEAHSSSSEDLHTAALSTASPQEGFQDPTCGYIPCPVIQNGNVLTLAGNCATYSTLLIPDGYVLDGAGHFIMALDPPGNHFKGAIARNCGGSAFYMNLRLMLKGLSDVCDTGDDALAGIRFDNATGSVINTQIFNIRQGDGTGGCQEGTGILIRNQAPLNPTQHVGVQNNLLLGYQKAGVAAVGNVVVDITNNRMVGAGPIGNVAQSGIQVGLGATGHIVNNLISGHSYTGEGVASGILVYGGPMYGGPLSTDVLIQGNQLFNNDIGVYLSQGNADQSPPAVLTNIQVVDNVLHFDGVTNGYVYQAGISDLGTGNVIHSNVITGAGYDPATLPGSTFAVDVLAGPAASLAFRNPPQQVPVGLCSGPLIVQTQDVSGNLVVPTTTGFNITSAGPASPGIQFYADPACAGPAVTTLDLGNPQAQGRFYFRATTPGSVTVFVWNSDWTQGQTQQVFIPLESTPPPAGALRLEPQH
ncbi:MULTISPECIES: right-handed parallel beta-helix repeat-containing protein [Myxococcus]|uniref:right-handed parallel beta-helix repeat-containing protein n=1 Tax=Myxococcus TaxID=32 RepID=UPI0011420A4E|nr:MULTISPECIES: right-handed parallel beta-helix repeat-containing protein [Myxococcus]NOK00463.1 right-handed parallel beta-helix repeat-containing protein [Myxococcus xanthus]